MPGPGSSIEENYQRIRERIARAAERSSRRPEEITLVAISKTQSPAAIEAAFAAGVREFGENRVQEFEEKQPKLAGISAQWHLVGHLQSNKARRAATLFQAIDSVDSLALAQRLDRAVAEVSAAEKLSVLLEVRLAPEETKNGVEVALLPALAEGVLSLRHLHLRGLLCIPPFFEEPERARPYFRCLRELRDAVCQRHGCNLPELSMGMSHDFEMAIEEGATQVRIGTAIFGERGK
jgi:pyridoxal phosphate enzyme (YggS family)